MFPSSILPNLFVFGKNQQNLLLGKNESGMLTNSPNPYIYIQMKCKYLK